MHYRAIDLSAYPRREHFEHFLTMEDPFFNLTSRVDITAWRAWQKRTGAPFFLCFQYAVVRAANRVPAFRQRIRGEGIVEYDFCDPSYTVAAPDGTYRYCLVHANQPLEAYLAEGKVKQAAALASEHLDEEGDVAGQLFVSCVPDIDYNSLKMPHPDRRFSIPSFAWGQCRAEKRLALEDGAVVERERATIPVTVMVNHALVDGLHIGQFFANLREELRKQSA